MTAATERDERFLVTGSDGCIGSWVVRTLAARGRTVVAADVSTEGLRVRRLADAETLLHVEFVQLDITTPGAVAELIDDRGITRVIHLAALQIPFVAADPVRGVEVNALGTTRVFEAVRHAGRVRGLAYASSTAAVGTVDPAAPETLYGVLKAANEHTARIYARDYGTPSIGLRPCVVYGPNRDQGMTSAITTAIKAVALGCRYEIPFGCDVDLQYAEDVAWAFIRAALAGGDGARVFDLHGDLVSPQEVIAALQPIAPEAGELISVGSAELPGRFTFDDAALEAHLGRLPKTTPETGIAKSYVHFAALRDAGLLTADEVR